VLLPSLLFLAISIGFVVAYYLTTFGYLRMRYTSSFVISSSIAAFLPLLILGPSRQLIIGNEDMLFVRRFLGVPWKVSRTPRSALGFTVVRYGYKKPFFVAICKTEKNEHIAIGRYTTHDDAVLGFRQLERSLRQSFGYSAESISEYLPLYNWTQAIEHVRVG
jgi:hypothetical protein